MIRIKKTPQTRICQGDIIRNVECPELIIENHGILEISKIRFPLIMVLTQDCDLEQDYRFRKPNNHTQDKWLISVLVAPLYNAEHVFQGNHLSEIGIQSQSIKKSGTEGKLLIQNQRPRYHYLEFPDNIELVPSIIDFKHYFSVHINYLQKLKRKNFVCTVSELFREDISARFSGFLSRIGLPDLRQKQGVLEAQQGN